VPDSLFIDESKNENVVTIIAKGIGTMSQRKEAMLGIGLVSKLIPLRQRTLETKNCKNALVLWSDRSGRTRGGQRRDERHRHADE
jgi:hypothetical protein